ncbi:hypothetical protein EZS27_030062 [termite gut metagenome]|uniref:Uncharacterized protein n=1 Tax=termite gut metagenome TaxID=433724 RepID=A0A5J4QHP7_9ZZZZ
MILMFENYQIGKMQKLRKEKVESLETGKQVFKFPKCQIICFEIK